MSTSEKSSISWAPRVPQALIARLYALDAQGIYDDELLDEVGWMLYHRCQSFRQAVEATRGLVHCPACRAEIVHRAQSDEILVCACGWQMPWREYFKTIQRQQLSGADPILAFFAEFVAAFPHAAQAREKMLLIDRLLHGFHYHLKYGPTRAAAVNLITGRYHEVIEFLDALTYGPGSTPGLPEARQEWRATVDATAGPWNDDRLRRT